MSVCKRQPLTREWLLPPPKPKTANPHPPPSQASPRSVARTTLLPTTSIFGNPVPWLPLGDHLVCNKPKHAGRPSFRSCIHPAARPSCRYIRRPPLLPHSPPTSISASDCRSAPRRNRETCQPILVGRGVFPPARPWTLRGCIIPRPERGTCRPRPYHATMSQCVETAGSSPETVDAAQTTSPTAPAEPSAIQRKPGKRDRVALACQRCKTRKQKVSRAAFTGPAAAGSQARPHC